MTRSDLAQLSRDDLIDLVLEKQAEIEALNLKLEKGKKPPKNSSNSSQPPSRDQKTNLPAGRKRHRRGPPAGHMKYERKFIANPDHIVEVKPEVCKRCQTNLREESSQLVDINQITELPEAKAEVIEVRQYAAECPCCGQKQVGRPPSGLEMMRTFGARLEATVVYYRHEQHMSYERTQKALLNLHGVEISQGGIDGIMQRSGKHAIARLPAIETRVQQSQVIHCDETGSRVDGSNWWEWAFCTVSAVLHVIRFNRSVDVIQEVMGQCKAEVWVSDCYGAQLKAPAHQRQLCLAHQLRNLQAVVDAHPNLTWPRAMQILFRYAIHLYHQRDLLSPDEFAAQVVRVERHLDRLLQRSLSPPDAARLLRRYLKHRQNLFIILYRSDVDPTNNVAERALRPSVIHRKVTGCFRSDWGAKTYAALASVVDTAELAGIQAYSAIQSLFGTPALPIPMGGE
jgi:transposase